MFSMFSMIMVSMALSAAPPSLANVFRTNISPEEAQRYLNSPPFTEPQLSGPNNLPVHWNDPQFRGLGNYGENGREIDNTQNYVEDVHDRSVQVYHVGDGLGGYAYGYKTPSSSKVEKRQRSGDLTGSFTYRVPGHDNYKVRYWQDSEGFHQEDNLHEVLKPEQESEEHRQARLAHQRAWNEAAYGGAQQPHSQGDYNAAASKQQEFYQALEQSRQKQEQYQAQEQPRPYEQKKQYGRYGEPEPTGAARGFFYSNNDPAPKNEQHAGQNVNYDTIKPEFLTSEGSCCSRGEYNAAASEQQEFYQALAQNSLQQQGKQRQYEAQGQPRPYQQQRQYGRYKEPEPTGAARGFFHSYGY